MSINIPPDVLAEIDQRAAAARQLIEGILKVVHELIADDIEPNLIAERIAVEIPDVPDDLLKLAIGYLFVRLAKAEGHE